MRVKIFTTIAELQAFLTSFPMTKTKFVAAYFDAASGKHVLIHDP